MSKPGQLGVSSDPAKQQMFRELLNFSSGTSDDEAAPEPLPAYSELKAKHGATTKAVKGKKTEAVASELKTKLSKHGGTTDAVKGAAKSSAVEGKENVKQAWRSKGTGRENSERDDAEGCRYAESKAGKRDAARKVQAQGKTELKNKKNPGSKLKANPKRTTAVGNVTLADLGLTGNFSDSSDDGEGKAVKGNGRIGLIHGGKEIVSSKAQQRNCGDREKKTMGSKLKANPKRKTAVGNVTLADLGLTGNFSDSSDEGEGKAVKGEGRIGLIHGEKEVVPSKTQQRNCGDGEKKIMGSKLKANPKRKTAVGKVTLADLGLIRNFSDSSDEGEGKAVKGEGRTGLIHGEKGAVPAKAQQRNCGDGEKKTMGSKLKANPKRKTAVGNVTLADLGLTGNFSDSSDEGEGKAVKGEGRTGLIHGEKGAVPAKAQERNCGDGEKKRLTKTAFVSDFTHGQNARDSWKPAESQGRQTHPTKRSMEPPPHSTTTITHSPPAEIAEDSPALANLQEQAGVFAGSNDKTPAGITEDSPALAKSPKAMFIAGSNDKPLKKLGVDSKAVASQLFGKHDARRLQQPDMSVIGSPLLSGDLVLASPSSERSMLPLWESTRLDCPDTAAPKQNFGHLLAYQKSPELFGSPLGGRVGRSRDWSYEQLKIGVEKPASGVGDMAAGDGNSMTAVSSAGARDTGGTQTREVLAREVTVHDGACSNVWESSAEGNPVRSFSGTSESDAQFQSCLTSPDVSVYEVVDAAVQTSFEAKDSDTVRIEEGFQALCLQNSVQTSDSKSTDSNNEASSRDKPDCTPKAPESDNDGKNETQSKNSVSLLNPFNNTSDSGSLTGRSDETEPLPRQSPPKSVVSASGGTSSQSTIDGDEGTVQRSAMTTQSSKPDPSPVFLSPLPPVGHKPSDAGGGSSSTLFLSPSPRGERTSDSNHFSESGSEAPDSSGSLELVSHLETRSRGRRVLAERERESGGGSFESESPPPLETRGRGRRVTAQKMGGEKMSATQRRKGNEHRVAVKTERHQDLEENKDSSSDGDDDKLEAFFSTVRPPQRPTRDEDKEDTDSDNFVVNDSDVTESDDDMCYADVTRKLDITDSFLPKGRRRNTGRSRCGNSSSSSSDSSSEEDGDAEEETTGKGETKARRKHCHVPSNSNVSSSEEEGDDSSDDIDDVLNEWSTPKPRTKPTFSMSQTPREASPKWFTPATSIKPKPKPGRGNDKTKSQRDVSKTKPRQDDAKDTSLPTPKPGEGRGADNSVVWATPAPSSSVQRGSKVKVEARRFSFLRSLSSDTPDHQRDIEARSYIVHFKKKQEELSTRLFKLFNFTVFENQLPSDMAVVWNKRLLKTAGLCKQKRVGEVWTASVQLSTKVCDSAERLRDTLVHEMCHAAVWIINRAKEGHGPHWKYWARKANRAHPEIPVIRRCHDYSISTKFIYQCVKCGYQVGRHSKSLDTDRKVCGKCRGRFQLQPRGHASSNASSSASSLAATPHAPRTPNAFALFVKENYGSVRREGGGRAHGEVMEALSKRFAQAKIATT